MNIDAEDLFGVLLEPDQIQKRSSGIELDEQIDVALRRLIATCDRSKDSKVANAVTPGGTLEARTKPPQQRQASAALASGSSPCRRFPDQPRYLGHT
jgi:hypothetical protein